MGCACTSGHIEKVSQLGCTCCNQARSYQVTVFCDFRITLLPRFQSPQWSSSNSSRIWTKLDPCVCSTRAKTSDFYNDHGISWIIMDDHGWSIQLSLTPPPCWPLESQGRAMRPSVTIHVTTEIRKSNGSNDGRVRTAPALHFFSYSKCSTSLAKCCPCCLNVPLTDNLIYFK